MTKIKCPKDAGYGVTENRCWKESKDYYICTREKKHKGKHHAHITIRASDECCKTW